MRRTGGQWQGESRALWAWEELRPFSSEPPVSTLNNAPDFWSGTNTQLSTREHAVSGKDVETQHSAFIEVER